MLRSLRVIVTGLCCVLTCSTATAADAGAVLAQRGNANGALACATCHGQAGEGNPTAGFPRLAGLGKGYVERQLKGFASGQRQNPVMAPIAKALQPAERAAAADYYARLPAPARFSPASDAPAQGAMLAQQGRWENGLVPGCIQCHGPDGVGVGDAFPPLAGQSAAYIAQQLRAWQQGTRPPGPLNLMQAVATKLSPAEMDAVAKYFGGMRPSTAEGKGKP